MKLSLFGALFTMFGLLTAFAQDGAGSRSMFFEWDKLTVKPTPVGRRRDIHDAPTATLARFESHASTLRPGAASHPPHQHAQEEAIILQTGSLVVHINGQERKVGPGSLIFFASNDRHAVRNEGDVDATYLVFNFATAKTAHAPAQPAAESAPAGALRSGVFEWSERPVLPTPRGERREFVDSPTVTCERITVHATTLNPHETSHAPHRHPDEEIILVKQGRVAATVEGRTDTGGPGSIFFFASNEEHGLKNAGPEAATYYVLRVVTESTPTARAAK